MNTFVVVVCCFCVVFKSALLSHSVGVYGAQLKRVLAISGDCSVLSMNNDAPFYLILLTLITTLLLYSRGIV